MVVKYRELAFRFGRPSITPVMRFTRAVKEPNIKKLVRRHKGKFLTESLGKKVKPNNIFFSITPLI